MVSAKKKKKKKIEAYKENPYDDYHNKGLTQSFLKLINLAHSS